MMNRVIINDSEFSLQTQIAILNRSNELAHRIWNVYREFSENTGTNPIHRINAYCREAITITPDIKGHLGGIIKLTYSRFE